MNSTTLEGQGQNLTGNVKEAVGKVTGDDSLQAKGTADQVIGDAKQMAGAARDAIGDPGPLLDKARAFAKDRPWTTAALVGTLGVAVFNTLRGK
ncbi:CsbD family protein [Sphingomonas sp. CROZ-RG-20F-R02-07]|uniref:CsbD family protein n=1 Tax=Sphingomonas sp. CROZ-RG-20F-R02-07 TaxID=2914832 RepID=UPI001F5AF00C|nr:CsbD family protein [Sphingomonas sp. CROZ-RG-20F-R02-07]